MAEARARLDTEVPDEDLDARMGFLDHLDELRRRLIYSSVAVAVGMGIAFGFVSRLADFVLAPALATLPPGGSFVTTRPGEGFSFYLDLALIVGVMLAAPFVTYQAWLFVAPGLYKREKRLAVPFVTLTTLCTLAGGTFAHYVLFPSMMAFFARFDSPVMRFTPRVEDTFELYKNTVLGMVIVFQIPALVLFLAKIGAVSSAWLWRQLKFAVLVSFVAAALLTPSADPWNQALFAAPMIALYLLGIVLAWLVEPRRPKGPTDDDTTGLRLVVVATVVDQAARRRPKARGDYPRALHRR
jgi:sec-independent protein translocase protein TatC